MIYILSFFFFFFFNDTATTEIYTLSLHDALPISPLLTRPDRRARCGAERSGGVEGLETWRGANWRRPDAEHLHAAAAFAKIRSEEHTSELQSHLNLVCRLLLEKKKNK